MGNGARLDAESSRNRLYAELGSPGWDFELKSSCSMYSPWHGGSVKCPVAAWLVL